MKIKIDYINNEKIKEMIEKQKKYAKQGFTLSGIAIFTEVGATISAPNPELAAITIASVIGVGICATKVVNIDKKIENYIESHQKKLEK